MVADACALRRRARQRVGCHACAGVVFHAVDAVGIGRQRPHPFLPLQRLRQAHAELARAAAAPLRRARGARAHGDRGLAARKDHARPRKRLAVARHRTRQRGVHLAHLARLALHLVGQDVRRHPRRARRIRRCLQRLLGCRDHVHRMAGKADIAGLGGFQRTGLQRCVHGGGNVDAVARQDVQRVSAGAGVGDRGAAGDHGGVVPRHIADGQRDDARRRAGCRQATALDAREVLAHAVHLADGGAAFQQCAVDALFLLQRDAFGRQREQRRATARDETQHQVVFGQPAGQRQDALGRGQARRVGHGVRGLDDFQALRQPLGPRRYVAVARDHQPRQRRILRP